MVAVAAAVVAVRWIGLGFGMCGEDSALSREQIARICCGPGTGAAFEDPCDHGASLGYRLVTWAGLAPILVSIALLVLGGIRRSMRMALAAGALALVTTIVQSLWPTVLL